MKKSTEETSIENVSSSKSKMSLKSKIIGLIVLIVLVVGGYYVVTIFFPGQDEATRAQAEIDKKVAETVAKVKLLMALPEDEMPQIAEIKDASLAAQEQPFYSGSQNGDLVLIYPIARKAIVYSPSRNIIVNAGPIFTDQPEEATETETSED